MPTYYRFPKWPEAILARHRKQMDHLNLARVRRFIERGQLDARFPITQRHLHDSGCIKVKQGVRLFNVNDYPFPYKITIEVCGADQSSIDAVRRVKGDVRIRYFDRVNLRAHLKPYKFEVLPKTSRPNLEMVHYLEKMRARGCEVSYIEPQWLVDQKQVLAAEMEEEKSVEAAPSIVAIGAKTAQMAPMGACRHRDPRDRMRMSLVEAEEQKEEWEKKWKRDSTRSWT